MGDAIDAVKLDRLAEVGVRVGLNLQPGQDLILTAPAAALPLVRRVVAAAYQAGAGLVTTILSDEALTLARYRHGGEASFDRAPDWLYDGMAQAFARGAARMAIVGDDPMLLAGENPDHVSRAARANATAYKPALEKISNFDINWSIISWPGVAWARQVFPELSAEDAQERLADAIFAASRVTNNDPVAAWADHNAALARRRDWLNAQRFDALHFRGPGTDLVVGLAEGHAWAGGASTAKNGVTCNANIPTEEVFTTPHARRVDGVARATKPLAHQGTLIEGIEVRFEAGRIVEAKATRGEAVLLKLLDTDEGARRLGEVALVPSASPISESGILFYNTLFDENAACHIALGQCYAKCFEDGTSLSRDEIMARGGNQSLIHVDWMIGGPETEIDGIKPDGTRVPVFRKGGWA
jgi:aminopeptidase